MTPEAGDCCAGCSRLMSRVRRRAVARTSGPEAIRVRGNQRGAGIHFVQAEVDDQLQPGLPGTGCKLLQPVARSPGPSPGCAEHGWIPEAGGQDVMPRGERRGHDHVGETQCAPRRRSAMSPTGAWRGRKSGANVGRESQHPGDMRRPSLRTRHLTTRGVKAGNRSPRGAGRRPGASVGELYAYSAGRTRSSPTVRLLRSSRGTRGAASSRSSLPGCSRCSLATPGKRHSNPAVFAVLASLRSTARLAQDAPPPVAIRPPPFLP